MRTRAMVVLALFASSCVSLTPEGAHVMVYSTPVNAPPERRQMPDGCQRLATLPKDSMSEQDIEGQSNPFTKQRNASGGGGGNVLVVMKELVRPRRDIECPGNAPIRDCPGVSGALFNVEFESYRCTPEAIKALSTPKGPTP